MKPYKHKVAYYETDRMGITHHSNYIRWMEEARVEFLAQAGFGYEQMEDQGVISPVLSANCNYKRSTTFGDTVSIVVYVKEMSPAKIRMGYKMYNAKTGELCTTGETSHCFIASNGRPIRIKRDMPEFFDKMTELAAEYEEENGK